MLGCSNSSTPHARWGLKALFQNGWIGPMVLADANIGSRQRILRIRHTAGSRVTSGVKSIKNHRFEIIEAAG
jgi:hypothetical protein